MKLIDADAAIDALDKLCNIVCAYSKKQRAAMCGACPLGSAFDVIDNMPTVDAVEVIRCGECKHMTAKWKCLEFADDCLRPSASDFCSYGERRQDG